MRTLKPLSLIGILALSVFTVLLTLRIPVSIPDQTKLMHVWLGHPFAFVRQNFSGIDPPYFPWDISFASPWRHGITFSWPFFFLDVILVFLVLLVVFIVTEVSLRRLP